MRVPRALIGKDVKIIWRDPTGWKGESSFPSDHRDLPKGRNGLARWVTHGLIEDITEGVVRITKTWGEDPIVEKEQTHRLEVDYIPEELITTVVELKIDSVHGESINQETKP